MCLVCQQRSRTKPRRHRRPPPKRSSWRGRTQGQHESPAGTARLRSRAGGPRNAVLTAHFNPQPSTLSRCTPWFISARARGWQATPEDTATRKSAMGMDQVVAWSWVSGCLEVNVHASCCLVLGEWLPRPASLAFLAVLRPLSHPQCYRCVQSIASACVQLRACVDKRMRTDRSRQSIKLSWMPKLRRACACVRMRARARVRVERGRAKELEG